MVRSLSSVGALFKLCSSSARPSSFRKLFAAPVNPLFYRSKNARSAVTCVDGVTLEAGLSWKFREELAETTTQLDPPNVAPLASLVVNQSTAGRVFCANHSIYFQIGGAVAFETLCKNVQAWVTLSGRLHHYRFQQVRQLQYNQMVLCDEDLKRLLLFEDRGSVKSFGVPGALYRGRLLDPGETLPSNCSGRFEPSTDASDRLEVELVDIGLSGYVHASKIMPMPQTVINMPSSAITIGVDDGGCDRISYAEENLIDGKSAGFAFRECCDYVRNAQFVPTFVHPDREHAPSELGADAFIRRADGFIKFEMPENVVGIPEQVVKIIKKDSWFKTVATRYRK